MASSQTEQRSRAPFWVHLRGGKMGKRPQFDCSGRNFTAGSSYLAQIRRVQSVSASIYTTPSPGYTRLIDVSVSISPHWRRGERAQAGASKTFRDISAKKVAEARILELNSNPRRAGCATNIRFIASKSVVGQWVLRSLATRGFRSLLTDLMALSVCSTKAPRICWVMTPMSY